MITLLDRALLLKAYCTPVSKSFGEDSAKHMAFNRLQNAGLIRVEAEVEHIVVTEKGRCFAEAMRSIPLPVATWVIPVESEETPHG